MKIGFDFDGVISSLNFWRIPKVIRRTFTAMQKSVAEKVHANQGALDLIHDLQKKGHQVVIVTGRYRNVQKETAAWMKKHELPQLKIIYNSKEMFSRDWLKQYKVSTIKKLKLDVYIEDQPELAEAIARHTKAEVVLHRGDWDETARDVMAAIRDIRKARKNPADIIGFDIDGVLTVTPPDHRERIVREGERYREFIQREGPPNVSMLRFVRELVKAGNEVHFITGRVGEPALERTKVWFNKNGLADLVGHLHINREGTDPKDIRLDKRHKEKTINRLGVMEYYEDNAEIAEHLSETTKAKIILYKTSRENPSNPMQIILSVPHAVGLPAATGGSGGMKGHDYIATEMANRLAQRLGVPDSHLLIGDLPRDLMDLNRERNRWKAHFRAKLRNLIKQDPGNTIHIDVHSFRVNSKVYAGNDIAIVTTEKTPRPYEVDLLRFFADNDIRSKIYTEMLMDVVPEARELGAGFSVLLEFNEGTTPEQRDHYADLVAQFIRRKAGTANPQRCYKCDTKIEEGDAWVYETTSSTYGEGGVRVRHKGCNPTPNPEDVEAVPRQTSYIPSSSPIKGYILPTGKVESWKAEYAGGRPYHDDMISSQLKDSVVRFTITDYDVTIQYPESLEGMVKYKHVVRDLKKIVDFSHYYKQLYVSVGVGQAPSYAWLVSGTTIENFLKQGTLEAVSISENPERRPAPGERLHEPTIAERSHEMVRIRTMSMNQLELRMTRIRNPQKMYSFAMILMERSCGEYNRLANRAFSMLREMGYDGQGRPIVAPAPRRRAPRRAAPRRRVPSAPATPPVAAERAPLPPEGVVWDPLPLEGVVWDELPDSRASDILIHIGIDEPSARHDCGTAWVHLPGYIAVKLVETYNIKWNADGVIVVRETPRREELVTYRELEIGDLVEDTEPPEEETETDRYAVVARLGPIIDEASGAQHGDETSVWGIWERGVSAAGRRYLQALESDLRPIIPGLMQRTDGDEAKYRVETKGIFRTDEERYQHIKRHLEKRGTEVEIGDDGEMLAWLYIPVNAGEHHEEGTFAKNAEVGGRGIVLASTHPEIGFHYGDGTVMPVYVNIRNFEIENYLPHRIDLGVRDSGSRDFVSVTFGECGGEKLGEKFNVRSAGMVSNPHCVLCNDLQTPHVYYEDQFIIICKDIKGKKSLLGLLKRHVKKPAKWEELWLMRMLHFIAGEVFRNEFSVEKTMRTEPGHHHIHAIGNPSR